MELKKLMPMNVQKDIQKVDYLEEEVKNQVKVKVESGSITV